MGKEVELFHEAETSTTYTDLNETKHHHEGHHGGVDLEALVRGTAVEDYAVDTLKMKNVASD